MGTLVCVLLLGLFYPQMLSLALGMLVLGLACWERRWLGVLPRLTPEQRLGWLLAHLDSLPGSGIIYCLTVAAAEDVAEALRGAGHPVAAYTGRTDTEERERLEAAGAPVGPGGSSRPHRRCHPFTDPAVSPRTK